MKKSLLTLAAALALVGCSNEDLLNVDNNQAQNGNAIAFSTYVGNNAQTRASVVYIDDLRLNGFGVNAYYTGQEEFDADATYSGNAIFMDNTKVLYNPEKDDWTYSPVKYWPNNTFVNSSGATQYEMVSFFAYAPYGSDQINFSNESNKSKLSFAVDPDVKNQVDLIYHKADGDETLGCDKTIDLTKQSVNSRVSFNFQHALSRITFDVKAVVDETEATGDNLLDGNTRINIKKVALVKDVNSEEGPFYTSATLDLQSGVWSEKGGSQPFELEDDHFYRGVNVAGVDVVQLTKFNPEQTLLNEDSYLMIIPQDFSAENGEVKDGYRIYIEYDVISEEVDNNDSDENITDDSNTITNKIYSNAMHTTFEAGKAYKFTLLLGMTSVKFTADVDDWDNANDYDNEEWVPENSDGTEYIETGTPNSDGMYGSGTQEDPFRISTVEHLSTFNTLVSGNRTYTDAQGATQNYNAAYYMQMCDIDVSSKYNETDGGWNPIDFYGQYDGQNHNIKKLYIKRDDTYFGFIDDLYEGASISNLNFSDCHIERSKTGTSCQGGTCIVASVNEGATVSNCTVSNSTLLRLNSAIAFINRGTITGCINYADLTDCASSIVRLNYGIVEKCHNMGQLTMSEENGAYMGGLVYSNDGVIIECSNEGDLAQNSTYGYLGGIVNSNSQTGKIIACYNKGSWTLDTYEGGICGDNEGYIIGCYNLTPFSADETYTGGVVGLNNDNGQVIGCYSKSGNEKMGGLVGLNRAKVLNSYFEISTNVTTGVTRNDDYYYSPVVTNVFGVGSDGEVGWNIDGDESTNNAMYTMNKAIEEISETVPEAAGWHYEVNTDEATKDTMPLVVKYTAPAVGE